jgi:hypothetical protein
MTQAGSPADTSGRAPAVSANRSHKVGGMTITEGEQWPDATVARLMT